MNPIYTSKENGGREGRWWFSVREREKEAVAMVVGGAAGPSFRMRERGTVAVVVGGDGVGGLSAFLGEEERAARVFGEGERGGPECLVREKRERGFQDREREGGAAGCWERGRSRGCWVLEREAVAVVFVEREREREAAAMVVIVREGGDGG